MTVPLEPLYLRAPDCTYSTPPPVGVAGAAETFATKTDNDAFTIVAKIWPVFMVPQFRLNMSLTSPPPKSTLPFWK